MSTKIQVEHLARVEGHGGITVELNGDGAVSAFRFDIFEGARLLEGLVRGRSYEDISQILSRICSICSVAHSLTSLKATENALGVKVTPQTELLRDLLYRGESIQSHALHLFCLAVPDYLDYPSVTALAVDHLDAVKLGLRLKKLGNSIRKPSGVGPSTRSTRLWEGSGDFPAWTLWWRCARPSSRAWRIARRL